MILKEASEKFEASFLVLCNTRYFVFMTAYKGALRAP